MRIPLIIGRLAIVFGLVLVFTAQGQVRPYIGFVYPAGGQQGTTFQIRVGGQGIDDIESVLISGAGVTARLAENYRRLDPQEMQLLNEQLHVLRRETMSASARAMLAATESPDAPPGATSSSAATTNVPASASGSLDPEATQKLIARIEKRTLEYVMTPACAAIASLMLVEVTIAPNAEPGDREIRLVTRHGVSNPLRFQVGQVAERSKRPMVTATQQVLGKETQALRRRLPGDDEDQISLPCTVNGQIASGEVNRYRFTARQGQRLVITAWGRRLVPFIADAVPGWFQPVLTLYDDSGKEVAYDDDYRCNPDPTILFEVPKDGTYVFAIHDSLYRGREDFVYRISVGELPFITSLNPLGGRVGEVVKPETKGWNLQDAQLTPLPAGAGFGIYSLAASRKGVLSNHKPFALDELPEARDLEPNDTVASAQKVSLPVIVNGRIDKPDDWDVFQFTGKANDMLVAEVFARRLDSPLDSVVKLTDASGTLLALNDDHEDLGAGLNTHHADSYLVARLPADGVYFVHIGDTARQGGEEYGYRLRLSAPQPDFDLRVVPSSLNLRAGSNGTLTVYVRRKDEFKGPITLGLKDAPPGFLADPVTVSATQTVAQLTIKTDLAATKAPVSLSVSGSARIGDREVTRPAIPAEDCMQAFLWRQLVPSKDLLAVVFDPAYQPPLKRVPPARRPPVAVAAPVVTNLPAGTNSIGSTNTVAAARPRFTKEQVAERLKELGLLFEEGMFTDDFYSDKVAECEAGQ